MLYYLSLGSNMDDRHHYVAEACRLLSERCGTILRRSSDYYSEAVGYHSEQEYLNICLAIESQLQPMQLLWATQAIERALGRVEKTHIDQATGQPVYSDRPIDVDILLAYDSEGKEIRMNDSVLSLPHPRMQERAFVMVPLNEIKDTPSSNE